VGTGSVAEGASGGDGIVRLFEYGSGLKSAAVSVKTSMTDIDSLSLCSRSQLLFVGESSDCSVAIYDLRYVSSSSAEHSQPLFSVSHGQRGADAVVPHAWLRGGDLLASGGFDGRVCIWDCRSGFSLLRQLQFNASVACITAADGMLLGMGDVYPLTRYIIVDDLCLWVGTDNGGVYMVSSVGYLDEGHPVVIAAAKGDF
jgi:WD40 repeat protein